MRDRRGAHWPWLVTGALLFTVGVNVVMLFAASSDRNGSVVEPDYYRKAVAWDSTMARRAASDRLGWSAEVVLERPDDRGTVPGRLTVHLVDRDGASVRGADVTATLIHNTDAANPISLALGEREPGLYAGATRIVNPGRWEVRLEATRGSERFLTVAIVDVRTTAP